MPKPNAQAANTDATLALYDDYDLATLHAEQEEAKKASAGGKFLGKLPEGKTVLRYLPPRKGTKSPFRVVYRHYVDIPGVQHAVKFVCPRMEAKLPCRVCTKARQMQASSNPVDQERGKKLLPRREVLANCFKRANPEDGVKIHSFGKTVHDQLMEIRDPDQGLGINFTHPVTGRDIIIIRKGTGPLDTEYKVSVHPDGASPIADDAAKIREVLEQMHNLEAECTPPTDEEMQELLSGRKPQARRPAAVGNEFGGPTASDRVYDGQVVDGEDEE